MHFENQKIIIVATKKISIYDDCVKKITSVSMRIHLDCESDDFDRKLVDHLI